MNKIESVQDYENKIKRILITEEEIREKFLTYRVFEREFGKWKGKRILHRMLTK